MSTPVRFTTRDLECLPRPLDDTRYEIIDGDLHVSTQPQWAHQDACKQVAYALVAWDKQSELGSTAVAPA